MFRILLGADFAPVQDVWPESVDQGAKGTARPPVRGHVGDLEAGVGGQLQPAPELQSSFAANTSTSGHVEKFTDHYFNCVRIMKPLG